MGDPPKKVEAVPAAPAAAPAAAVEAPKPAPDPAKQAEAAAKRADIHQAGQEVRGALKADIGRALEEFDLQLGAKNLDLAGANDDKPENPIFKAVRNRIGEFFAIADAHQVDPALKLEWMNAATTKMVNDILPKFDGRFADDVEMEEVQPALEALKKDPEVGDFLVWLKAKHPDVATAYEAQKKDAEAHAKVAAEAEAAEAQSKAESEAQIAARAKLTPEITEAIQKAKTELGADANNPLIVARIGFLEQTIAAEKDPAAVTTNLKPLITGLPALVAAAKAIEGVGTIFGTIAQGPEKVAIAGEFEALKKKFSAEVSVDAAKLEQEAQALKPKVEEVAKTVREKGKKSLEDRLAAEDDTTLGSINKYRAKMKPDAPFKKILDIIANLLTKIGVALAGTAFTRGMVVGKLISNQTLAKNGDAEAKIAVRAQEEMINFGLKPSVIDTIGDKSVDETIKLLSFNEDGTPRTTIPDELSEVVSVGEKTQLENLKIALQQKVADDASVAAQPLTAFMGAENMVFTYDGTKQQKAKAAEIKADEPAAKTDATKPDAAKPAPPTGAVEAPKTDEKAAA